MLTFAALAGISLYAGCGPGSGDKDKAARLTEERSSFNIFADALSSSIVHYRSSMESIAELYQFGSANFQLPYCDLFLTYSVSELKTFDELLRGLLDRRRALIGDVQSLEISSFITKEATNQPSMMPMQATSPTIGRELDVDYVIVEQLLRPNSFFEAAADLNRDRLARMKMFLSAATANEEEAEETEDREEIITDRERETIIAFIASVSDYATIDEFLEKATQDELTDLADEITNIESYIGEPGETYEWGDSYSDFVRRKLYKLFEAAGQVAGSEIFVFLDDAQKGPKFEKLYGSSVTCSAGYYDYRSEVVSLNLLGYIEVRIPQGLASGTAEPMGILVPYRGGEYDESKPILLLDTTLEETSVVLKSNRVPQGNYRLVYAGGGMKPKIFEPVQINVNETIIVEPEADKYRMRVPSLSVDGSPYAGDLRAFSVELPSNFDSDYTPYWTFSPKEAASIGYDHSIARFRPTMPGVFNIYGWFKDINGETAYVSFSYEAMLDNTDYNETIEIYTETDPPRIEGDWEFTSTTQIGQAGSIGQVSETTIRFRQFDTNIEMSDEFGKYEGDITGTKEFFSASFEMRPDLGACQPYYQRVIVGFISADGDTLSGRAASVPIEMVGDCSRLGIGEEVTGFVARRIEFLQE